MPKYGKEKKEKESRHHHQRRETKESSSKIKKPAKSQNKPKFAERREALTRETGLSAFMLDVYNDMTIGTRARKDSSPSQFALISVGCCNKEGIRTMSSTEMAIHRQEFIDSKKSKDSSSSSSKDSLDASKNKKKAITDNMIRKYLLAKQEDDFAGETITEFGSTGRQIPMPADVCHYNMVNTFVGFAETNTGYCVYVYYVGPDVQTLKKAAREEALARLENWMIVPQNHLCHLHSHMTGRNIVPYFSHSRPDQMASRDGTKNPEYDPRYVVQRWRDSVLGKEKSHILEANKSLFTNWQDNLVRHYAKNKPLKQEGVNESANYYITSLIDEDEEVDRHCVENHLRQTPLVDVEPRVNGDDATPSGGGAKSKSVSILEILNERRDEVSVDIKPEETHSPSKKRPHNGGTLSQESVTFDVETDRLYQMRQGYEVKDEKYRYAGIEEAYSELSRFPLPKEITFDAHQLAGISRRSQIDDKLPPSAYRWQPVEAIEALAIAVNPGAFAKKCAARIADKQLIVLQNQSIEEVMEFMLNDPEAVEMIKNAQAQYIWSCLAVEKASHHMPESMKEKLREV